MSDDVAFFRGKRKDRISSPQRALKSDKARPDPTGLSFINGAIVSLDAVSLDAAYAALHLKLVKSYAMESMLEGKKKEKQVTPDAIRAFLDTAVRTSGTTFKSVGLGCDHLFEAPDVVGSALEHEGAVIHAAFFKVDAADQTPNMAGFRRRRSYRE